MSPSTNKKLFESGKKSKLIFSEEKSELINIKDASNENSISKLNINDIYDNQSRNCNMPLITRKISNHKNGSILSNSINNLFLTKINNSTNQNDINVSFGLNYNSSYNQIFLNEEKKIGINLDKSSLDDTSTLNNKCLVGQTRKAQGVIFDKNYFENDIDIHSRKRSNLKNENEIKANKDKSDFDRSTTINASGEQIIDESNLPKDKKTPLYHKLDMKKSKKERKNFLDINSSNKNKSKEELHNEKLGYRNKFINLSISDSESGESFLNVNRKNNKKVTNKEKLPPLKIGVSNNYPEGISFIEYKPDNKSLLSDSIKIKSNINQQKESLKKNQCSINDLKNNKENDKQPEKEGEEENEDEDTNKKGSKKKKKIDKNYFIPDINGGIYNLKLPKIYLHKKTKSHLEIIENLTKDIKPSFQTENYTNNITSKNIKSFIVTNQESENFDEDVLHTQENKLKLVNLGRIKPKRLPLELDKPKYNNSRQEIKDQIFLKKFIKKCKYQQNDITNNISTLSHNIGAPDNISKNESINIVRRLIEEQNNQKIDKELFLMDNPRGLKEKTIILKGPPMKKENKFLFEDKNNSLSIGQAICKLDEVFTFKCKDVLESRFIIPNAKTIRNRKLKEESKNEKINEEKNNVIHIQIEKICDKIEKLKINAMKDLFEK